MLNNDQTTLSLKSINMQSMKYKDLNQIKTHATKDMLLRLVNNCTVMQELTTETFL